MDIGLYHALPATGQILGHTKFFRDNGDQFPGTLGIAQRRFLKIGACRLVNEIEVSILELD